MTTYRLDDLAPSWDALRAEPAHGWLWLDMVVPGLHTGATLPETQPAQLSHVWGWGAGWWIRVRADVDLPGGLVGARLTDVPETEGTPDLAVTMSEVTPWATTDGQVSLPGDPGLDGLRKITCAVTRVQSGQLTLVDIDLMDVVTP